MIIHISRGFIKLEINGKAATVHGEALFRIENKGPDFVVYLNSIEKWDNPKEESISPKEKEEIIADIKKGFDERKMNVEFE